ncbi:MAG: twin-arginine translocase TatA/TatE family subunit [Corynebacterium flavescens]|uniref:twin-arginine translocase TatA/TatE family subunit n=1 Tax=Corynebacterium TaxID=1716 RepID=UPI00257F8095|nr:MULTISPECIES: twin-arginine translocase TatA/TatE family subunit [Corynebacterium]MDN6531199.1 twin-arginine translocase TatA/TatE family subunit [Corynebacterium flavescens]
MFSSIGWTEIAVIILLAIVVIGPERLPGVIADVRAAIYAARKAINNAKAELNGEMGELSSELQAFSGPISQAAEWSRLGPRGAITKALLDGDDSVWDDFNPKKLQEDLGKKPQISESPVSNKPKAEEKKPDTQSGDYSSGGGFSWADIT